jgi:hypothetical protein
MLCCAGIGILRSSDFRDEYLMLDRDLPTTADDIVALGNAREARRMPLEEDLAFLAGLGAPEPERLRSGHGPSGPLFRLVP